MVLLWTEYLTIVTDLRVVELYLHLKGTLERLAYPSLSLSLSSIIQIFLEKL